MQLTCEMIAMLDSLDLSGYRDASAHEIAALLERLGDEPQEQALSAVTALLMNRTLRLLRQGSRQEILDETLMLSRFLALPAGKRLEERHGRTFSGWTALGELLAGAARSTSRAAVPSILKSTQGRGQEILEMLAGESGPVPRSTIKKRLGLAEAQLSHLLRDLEAADLIIRYRPQGGKVVLVELGPMGREVASPPVVAKGEAEGRPEGSAQSAPEAKILQFIRKVENLREGGVSRLQEMDISEALSARALFGTDTPPPHAASS